MTEPLDLDATGQAELVRKGEVKPQELVDAAIARAEAVNPQLNAVILPRYDEARGAAAGELPNGPFRGVPFLLKDLGANFAGWPNYNGMQALKDADWKTPVDAVLAARFREAGFVTLGRTNSPELGLAPTTEPSSYGASHNPWNLEHSPGGSSGGSAAAVAAGIVAAAHSSDGGGSIRIPAAHCGLVGLKPSRGRNSFGPETGERWFGCSAEGVVTHTVRDTAAILDATEGSAPGDPYVAPPPARPYAQEVAAEPGRLRIGLVTQGWRGVEIHAENSAASTAAGKALEGLGHTVELSHPDALEDNEVALSYVKNVMASCAMALESWGQKIGCEIGEGDVEPMTWEIAKRGREMPAHELAGAVSFMHGLGRKTAAWHESGFDLLVTPTCGQPPPVLGELVSPPDNGLLGFVKAAPYGLFTMPFNMTGQPGISLPLHWSAAGLPIGVQLVAPYGREDLLIQVAAQLEEAMPWRDRRPPVHG
ncbi:MAG: amidase [Deltaproteobacteria bacterium]|nr:amidase [Deltaproteobacteria bacterium]